MAVYRLIDRINATVQAKFEELASPDDDVAWDATIVLTEDGCDCEDEEHIYTDTALSLFVSINVPEVEGHAPDVECRSSAHIDVPVHVATEEGIDRILSDIWNELMLLRIEHGMLAEADLDG